MLRETTDRLVIAGCLVRPKKPHFSEPAYHHSHHAVHQALMWLHELTDAPLRELHDELAIHQQRNTKVTPTRLRELAHELLKHLYAHDSVLTPQEYAAIYHQISQGLNSKDEEIS